MFGVAAMPCPEPAGGSRVPVVIQAQGSSCDTKSARGIFNKIEFGLHESVLIIPSSSIFDRIGLRGGCRCAEGSGRCAGHVRLFPERELRNLSFFGVRLSWEESAVRGRGFAREWAWHILPVWQLTESVGWSPTGAL